MPVSDGNEVDLVNEAVEAAIKVCFRSLKSKKKFIDFCGAVEVVRQRLYLREPDLGHSNPFRL